MGVLIITTAQYFGKLIMPKRFSSKIKLVSNFAIYIKIEISNGLHREGIKIAYAVYENLLSNF